MDLFAAGYQRAISKTPLDQQVLIKGNNKFQYMDHYSSLITKEQIIQVILVVFATVAES